MPRCKSCHQMLSSLDKDICPFCGTLKPFEGQDDKTNDITEAFDPIKADANEYQTKSRKITAILWMLLGFSGAPMFYIKKPKAGLIAILITLIMILGAGSMLFFLVPGLKNAFGYLIPIFVILITDIIVGLIYLFNRDLKDGTGEVLK